MGAAIPARDANSRISPTNCWYRSKTEAFRKAVAMRLRKLRLPDRRWPKETCPKPLPTSSPISFSCAGFRVLNLPTTPRCAMPDALRSDAAASTSPFLIGATSMPRLLTYPETKRVSSLTRRSSGARPGPLATIIPTRAVLPWTMALVDRVVLKTTRSMAAGFSSRRISSITPMSDETRRSWFVGTLVFFLTWKFSRRTASVWVPPTSMPRIMQPPLAKGEGRKAEGKTGYLQKKRPKAFCP